MAPGERKRPYPTIAGCERHRVAAGPARVSSTHVTCGHVLRTTSCERLLSSRDGPTDSLQEPLAAILAAYERYLERIWLDHLYEWPNREMHPLENMPDYGRDSRGDEYAPIADRRGAG